MTIVGKILVFVNLVFSLVVGGLVMMVFMTRTNWEKAYLDKEAQYKAVDADRRQTAEDAAVKVKEAETQLTAVKKERDDAITQRDKFKKDLNDETEKLKALKADDRVQAADGGRLQTSVDARKQQVADLEKTITDLQGDKLKLIESVSTERKGRIQADVEARSYKTRNLDLESQVRDMARELIRARSPSSAGGFVVRKRGDENPPPDNVEGRIKDVDPEDGLVKLSIGSDAGLAQGHTLKVFRLHPIPEQSKYLGTIEILTVRPHEAVGRPVTRPSFSIRPGDRVASRLLVGGN